MPKYFEMSRDTFSSVRSLPPFEDELEIEEYVLVLEEPEIGIMLPKMGLLKKRTYCCSVVMSFVNVPIKDLVSMHIERFSRFNSHSQ